MNQDVMEPVPLTSGIALIDAIPLGEGRRVRVGPTEVAVFRTRSGDVYAVQPECPHLGGPLADGMTGGGRVICPLHGYVFDLASGEPVGNGCEALRTYPVHVGPEGEIKIDLGHAGGAS